jgi:integrase
MARPRNQVPTYRLHKQSGQAVVTVTHNGTRKDILLGKHGSPESKAEYERVLAQLRSPAGVVALVQSAGKADLTVAEVFAPFLEHVEQHYRHPDGTPTSEVYNFKLSLRVVRELFAHTPAVEFGPRALKTVRQTMIDKGWCRKQINARIGRIKRAFKWAASEELLPVEVHQRLATVEGLKQGRSAAKDREPIAPVPEGDLEKTLPQLNRHVRGLVEFQRLTGCRPGEVCRLRECNLDKTGDVWLYRPTGHKTAHRGKTRVIPIGPKCQTLLRGFFTENPEDYLFSPKRATAEHHAARTAARKTPRYPSHMKRNSKKRVTAPKRGTAERYSLDAYNQAIERACIRAGIPAWTPNQLRHSFATEVRKEHGLEAAQVLLGHSKANTTEIYAERNEALAASVATKIG